MDTLQAGGPAAGNKSDHLSVEIPGAAFRLVLNSAVVHTIRARVLETGIAAPAAQIGGVLFGRTRQEPGARPAMQILHVDTFEYSSDSLWRNRRRAKAIERSCARSAGGALAPVGLFRTAGADGLELTRRDAEDADRFFRGPDCTLLIVKPVSTSSFLVVLFTRTKDGLWRSSGPPAWLEVDSKGGPVLLTDSAEGRPEHPAGSVAGPELAREPMRAPTVLPARRSGSRKRWAWPAAGLALLAAGAGGAFLLRTTLAKPQPGTGSQSEAAEGLRVEMDGSSVRAAWNRHATLFHNARVAVLTVRDGLEQRQVPLDLRLDSGIILYIPRTADVEFQVRTYGDVERSQSVRLLGVHPAGGSWTGAIDPGAISGQPLSPLPPFSFDSLPRQEHAPRKEGTGRSFIPPALPTRQLGTAALPSAPEVQVVQPAAGVILQIPASGPPPPALKRDSPAPPPPQQPPIALQAPQEPATQPQLSDLPSPPVPKRREMPRIPSSYSQQMRGQVAVSMDVDETGKVASVRLLRSSAPNHWVDTMVLQAARDWLFTPATVHGHPVPASVEITFDLNRR